MKDVNVGDVVRLKCGSPQMVVTTVDSMGSDRPKKVLCQYFNRISGLVENVVVNSDVIMLVPVSEVPEQPQRFNWDAIK